jgi:hypothetical protein
MSHVHVKINFSLGIDSWNRCLSVHKRLQIRALLYQPGANCFSGRGDTHGRENVMRFKCLKGLPLDSSRKSALPARC